MDSKLKELAQKANTIPQPWVAHPYSSTLGTLVGYGDCTKGENIACVMARRESEQGIALGRYIAAANPAAVLDLITRLEKAEAENAALRESYASPCGKHGHLSSNAGRTGDRKGMTFFCVTCQEIAEAKRETWEKALEIVRGMDVLTCDNDIDSDLFALRRDTVAAIRAAMEETR